MKKLEEVPDNMQDLYIRMLKYNYRVIWFKQISNNAYSFRIKSPTAGTVIEYTIKPQKITSRLVRKRTTLVL